MSSQCQGLQETRDQLGRDLQDNQREGSRSRGPVPPEPTGQQMCGVVELQHPSHKRDLKYFGIFTKSKKLANVGRCTMSLSSVHRAGSHRADTYTQASQGQKAYLFHLSCLIKSRTAVLMSDWMSINHRYILEPCNISPGQLGKKKNKNDICGNKNTKR